MPWDKLDRIRTCIIFVFLFCSSFSAAAQVLDMSWLRIVSDTILQHAYYIDELVFLYDQTIKYITSHSTQ